MTLTPVGFSNIFPPCPCFALVGDRNTALRAAGTSHANASSSSAAVANTSSDSLGSLATSSTTASTSNISGLLASSAASSAARAASDEVCRGGNARIEKRVMVEISAGRVNDGEVALVEFGESPSQANVCVHSDVDLGLTTSLTSGQRLCPFRW